MAQYQVPQFIELEDRIIGPLTLKQFLYLAFAGALLFVFWFLFAFYIWIIVVLPIIALAAAFAFLKINDRPFVHFFLAFIKYFTKPKLYIFSGTTGKQVPAPPLKPSSVPQSEALESEKKKITLSKLKELALSLDTGSKRVNEQLYK
ncbi:MAG: PrgI family protein [Candidatus Azambacteria bacterium]|nr:PrgI family protein [Candidatus Azambacteria bacterium]